MGQRLSFDTTFLIDLQKEKRSGGSGPAHSFLNDHSDAGIFLSAVALGEFAEGFAKLDDPTLRRLLGVIEVLSVDEKVSLVYAENTRRLRKTGRLIGSNDLWIGCCAVRYLLPLVTRNGNHFARISRLEVIDY